MSASEDDCCSSSIAPTVTTAGVGPGGDEKQHDEVARGHRVECAVCNVRSGSLSFGKVGE